MSCEPVPSEESALVTLPNFIIIGAAKAGTTALYWYLAEHPDVFMSPVKEANYFAYGRDAGGRLVYGDPEVHQFPVTTLADYEQLLAGAGGAMAIGEASPIYLECPQSAARIRAMIPGARILCSIRHPVDRAYSNYLMYLRRRGRRLDPECDLDAGAAWAHPDSRWMRIGRYHEQLRRYFEAFPRSQIHVSLFEDLTRNPPALMRDVYRFVNVDPAFTPDFATPHAPGGMPASRWLEGLFGSSALRAAVEPWVPTRAANWVRRLRTRNMRKAPPLPPALKQELTGHFREDIGATSELIGRSLQHWL
jgi:hypothetical protein